MKIHDKLALIKLDKNIKHADALLDDLKERRKKLVERVGELPTEEPAKPKRKKKSKPVADEPQESQLAESVEK